MKGLFAAFGFLTILPVPRAAVTEEGLRRASGWFPVVGIALGLLLVGAGRILFSCFPPLPAAMLVVGVMALLSRGLHLDGLADAADAMLSHRPRERMLEIMRDSRIGTMGVLALFFALGGKVTMLAMINPRALPPALFLVPLLGRCAMVVAMHVSPYARKDGLGRLFYDGKRDADLLLAILLPVGVAWVWGGASMIPMVMALLVLLVPCGVGYTCNRMLGGATGDTLGAVCELAEVTALTLFSLMLSGRAQATFGY